jgi:hypothetical protein
MVILTVFLSLVCAVCLGSALYELFHYFQQKGKS